MTPLTAAERQRLERHRVQCPLPVVHLPCDTCVLLDALDATDMRASAWEATAVAVTKERDEARRVAIEDAARRVCVCHLAWQSSKRDVFHLASCPASKLLSLLPQPDAPAVTAEGES